MSKRCVVTGLGLVCALGDNVDKCWENALNAVSGIKVVKSVNTDGCYANKGAEADIADDKLPDYDYDRSSLLCIKAAEEAVKDSGLTVTAENADRIGVITGNCVGGAASIDKYYTELKNGCGKATDTLRMSASPLANNVALHFGMNGVTANIVNACAAGTISLGYACDLIRQGEADVFLAGGSDAFSSLAYGGFHALHALDADVCSPFNRSSGITLGEGAGILVIESYEHAVARGAKIYCEVLGSGVSSDAHHITAPRPDGQGQMSAIKRAMDNSGLTSNDIDYINAHGTGTAKNDEAEFLSLHTLFDSNEHLSVSSTKSMTGHCLGAAGSIEAVFAVKSVCEDQVPPTVGYTAEDLEKLKEKAGKMDFTPNESRKKDISYVMSNSFAFGGTNASIIFAKNPHEIPDNRNEKRIFVTGIGKVISAVDGTNSVNAPIGAADYAECGIKMAFYRKLDRFSQIQLVSGMRSLADAEITVDESNESKIGIIIGTSDGPATEIVNFQKNVIDNGTASGSAFTFPNTVYNAAGGYFSIYAGVKGYGVTVANSWQAGLQSLCYACDVLHNGEAEVMVAAGTDENTEVVKYLYETYGVLADSKPYTDAKDGFVLGEGSVSLVLETEESVNARGVEKYAEVAGCAVAHQSVAYSRISGTEDAMKRVILAACQKAGIAPDDIDAVCGFGNGCKAVDQTELAVYKELFGKAMPIVSVKEQVGEARAAAGAMQAAVAAELLSGKTASMAAHILDGGAVADGVVESGKLNYVLAVSAGTGGSYSAVILKKA